MSGAADNLPYNLDAERSVLGSLLIDTDAIVKIYDKLTKNDFYSQQHQYIYEALTSLYDNRKAIDVLTLSNELKARKHLDDAGGASYLTELTNDVPTASHVESYAALVVDKSVRRQLIQINKALNAQILDETKVIKDVLGDIEAELLRVSEGQIKDSVVSLETILESSFERLDALHRDKKKLRGIPTGYKDLDNMTAGLQRSDLFILAARPSMGKAQPLDAKVLTTEGWKLMGDMKVGDKLASIDGAPSEVTGVFPQGNKQIYTITFSDGRTAECCGEHLWQVHYRTWDTPKVLTTDQIMAKLSRKRYQRRLWIDQFSGEFGQQAELPIAPWTLGMLLGEGDFKSMRVSTASPHVLKRLTAELGQGLRLIFAGGYDYRIVRTPDSSQAGFIGIRPNPLRQQLKTFGLWGLGSHEKFIPELYKSSSRSSRLALLQGLLDADGWIETFGTVRFATSSPQLADDVVDLARSLGGWASKHPKHPTYTYDGQRRAGRLSYVINIAFKEPERLFTLPEKRARAAQGRVKRKLPVITSIEPVRVAKAQCVKVSHPSELYITDNYVVTHNTAFVLNLAHNIAVQAKEPVLIFSLEMSKDQLTDRLLSMESGVDAWALRTGNLTDADFEKIAQALGPLSEAPIYIDDTPSITIQDLRTKALREAHMHRPGVIIVDYLQLMSGGSRFGGDFNRVQEISEISRGLKGIARELNVPVVALSQLSRSVESRPDKIPQLSDLRESGSIEQDADIVAFIFREDYYNPESERKGVTDILIKKHRNGPTGEVELYFDKDRQRFRSMERSRTASDPFAAKAA